MILQPFEKKIVDTNLKDELIDMTVNAIKTCQNYIRDKYDVSSVSLREVRRFIIFYEWFFDFLNKKKKEKYQRLDFSKYLDSEIKHQRNSIILSIYTCYYIRIFNKEYRKELKEKMNTIFGIDFEDFPLKLSRLIADEVETGEGIAKNRSLLDNLFGIFVCVSNKVPIFICGKPGCSKSLSVQLIFKTMIGEDSPSQFFKQEPKIIRHSYQGSLSSTSEGVLKLFKVARKAIEKRENNNQEIRNVISMIYFDEMGLAEISPNNPLKVMHSQLEYDENKEKVAFVGISNWTLDASKMNRGIYLSIPVPDEQDLIETATKIAESYSNSLNVNYEKEISELAQSYYEYKEYLSKQEEKKKDFHGLRDFYHLIKVSCKNLLKESIHTDLELLNILINSIERNFAGLKDSVKQFKIIFKKKHPNATAVDEYDVKNCIIENMKDNTSRYLLLVTKASISQFLINSILKELNKTGILFIGSKFEKDIKEESYSAGLLNKLQYTVSQDNVMILKNLDSIYPSLYDLFNQNFIKAGERNYARISLGYSKTHTYFVNNNFKCVVLLDETEIEKQDPSFLNIFEKHIVSFDFLLNRDEIKKSKEISKTISELIDNKNSKEQLKIDLSKQLLNCDLEEIQGMIYKIKNRENMEDILTYIVKKIAPTLSQDIIAFAKNSGYINKNRAVFDKILEFYNKYEHGKLTEYLKTINTSKHVIYTFSNIMENIFGIKNDERVINDKYGEFNNDNCYDVLVEGYNSEREIEDEIRKYYESNKLKLCIFRFEENDCIHLNHINFLIENYENQTNRDENNKKPILFIIHLKRYLTKCIYEKDKKNIENNYLISHISDYPQVFIDNLSGNIFEFEKILNYNNNLNEMIDLQKEFEEGLYYTYTTINYTFYNVTENFNKDDYIQKSCNFLLNNINYKNYLIECIKKEMISSGENIVSSVFYDNTFERNDIDFVSVIYRYLCNLFRYYLNKTIIKIERDGVLSCLIYDEDNINEKERFFQIYLENLDINDVKFDDHLLKNPVSITLNLGFPSSSGAFENIIIYIESIKDDYLKNEADLTINDDNDEDAINNYNEYKSRILDNVNKELESQILYKLFKENEENNYNLLLKDFFTIYISKYLGNVKKKEIELFMKITELYIKNKQLENIELRICEIILFFQSYSMIFQNYIKIIRDSKKFF